MSSIFTLITEKLGWLSKRNAVLTNNIVNAATPGFEAKDLKENKFDKKIGNINLSVGLAKTNINHLGASPHSQAANAGLIKVEGEKSLSGNTVDAETEMMKVNETGTKYYEMTAAYNHYDKLFNIAIGRGGR